VAEDRCFLERRARVLWRIELDRFRGSLEEYELVLKTKRSGINCLWPHYLQGQAECERFALVDTKPTG
jgi:hypothetical protein